MYPKRQSFLIWYQAEPKNRFYVSQSTKHELYVFIYTESVIQVSINTSEIIFGVPLPDEFRQHPSPFLGKGMAPSRRWPSTIDKELFQGLCGCLKRSQSPPGKLWLLR